MEGSKLALDFWKFATVESIVDDSIRTFFQLRIKFIRDIKGFKAHQQHTKIGGIVED